MLSEELNWRIKLAWTNHVWGPRIHLQSTGFQAGHRMNPSILSELAKSVQHPLGYAGFALALLLFIASKHWSAKGTRTLAWFAGSAAAFVLVAGLLLAFLTVRGEDRALHVNDTVPTAPHDCVVAQNGNTIINTGSGRAAGAVCGDVR
jgi:hypothetical protein